jgi:hypothetical protein
MAAKPLGRVLSSSCIRPGRDLIDQTDGELSNRPIAIPERYRESVRNCRSVQDGAYRPSGESERVMQLAAGTDRKDEARALRQ